MRRAFSLSMACILGAAAAGCTSLEAELESIRYHPDTAILIGDVPYQINAIKCAEIRSIGPDGELNCYDAAGNRSAAMTPVGSWKRRFLREKLGMEWASPEHQEFLFYMNHQGGMQQAINDVGNTTLQAYSAASNIADMLEHRSDMEQQRARMKAEAATASAVGGMSAWQHHQFKLNAWYARNASYFREKGSSSILINP